ncbi:calpain-like protease palB/RIM13 [Cryptococcus wingfieldii CBS 7118]|uniref:Calpain-like protease palB/RIM13 n=1 Tax=Cryptococcus wingfieldii CBS 7118 TaxID=1295528 RepID=A0A1E3JZP2_9TREE|nr:calpain-like protease palB/RIM13 [Cryptococcus wingfieldii CBS 7118]ODO06320.1 calpain-like protease palB/RIM13 [Cryptococcus wingfieldii CBS 7118]
MAFRGYHDGIKLASDAATKAIQIEASLSSLSPLTSHIPTLQRAFPAYIAAAELYSNLLSSKLVPPGDVEGVKKKWRLVLDRAEKVKGRIEQLGGHVAKAQVGDEGEEAAVIRRGGRMNGVDLHLWSTPSPTFDTGNLYREATQPELAAAQLDLDPEWREIAEDCWEHQVRDGNWVLRQGPVADCSVVAAMGVGVEHDRLFETTFGWNNLYPQGADGRPRRSENGKYVLRLLLNGAWRSVVFDSLLPHSLRDGTPLFTTCHLNVPSSPTAVGTPWTPLALKGYFKVHGGYSLQGSNPSSDIYELTGWIPERTVLKGGFQREKEWSRVKEAWERGNVMVSLGTGQSVREGLVKHHAYGVVRLREEGDQRLLDIIDPGATSFSLSWDMVCVDFESLHINWKPGLLPSIATRHWSWAKPQTSSFELDIDTTNPQYRLQAQCSSSSGLPEVWVLLSQHIVNKDRPLDDIALHVFEEFGAGQKRRAGAVHSERLEQTNPYVNGNHVLVRYQLRRPSSSLIVVPSRDRGVYQTGFTLKAFAPEGVSLELTRLSRTMPFSETITGSLDSRNAGGQPGWPTHMINPQYRVVVQPTRRREKASGRITVRGDKDLTLNARLVWGKGELVFELSQDMVLADTGAYAHGVAYCDVPELPPGSHTLIISAFEPGQTGNFSFTFEATAAVALSTIPAEGAGMYSRTVIGQWSDETAGGRPSTGGYAKNPKVEVILPKAGIVLSRLYLPTLVPLPINLTIFKRAEGGALGEQVATTGPYADALCGVSTGKIKLEAGIYLFVPSTYEQRSRGGWTLKVWADVAISAEPV